jgi:hypothetical protein
MKPKVIIFKIINVKGEILTHFNGEKFIPTVGTKITYYESSKNYALVHSYEYDIESDRLFIVCIEVN